MMKIRKTIHRLGFYFHHGFLALLPNALFPPCREYILKTFYHYSPAEQVEILQRVAHLNQLSVPFSLPKEKITRLRDLQLKGHNSSYFLDFVRVMKYFPDYLPFAYQFGDVTTVPSYPTFVKSRPIFPKSKHNHRNLSAALQGQENKFIYPLQRQTTGNENSILLKLDSVRHFYIPPDRYHFEDKKPLLVWRGAAHQQHRIQFLEKFHHYPYCDVGCVHEKSKNKPYHCSFLTLNEQREYQFILSLEGNDVATNLKWILASNSLCFMRRPRFETWFCEGLLIPNYHYILLKDDFSDLPEKLTFYQKNTTAAKTIIAQANNYVKKFFDPQKELLISILTIEHYFSLLSDPF